jgi:hypothetical protein
LGFCWRGSLGFLLLLGSAWRGLVGSRAAFGFLHLTLSGASARTLAARQAVIPTVKLQHNKALHPTAYSLRFASLVPRFASLRLPAAGELSRSAGARNLDKNCGIIYSMPTVLRSGPYRFYFWGHEPDEPPHIHVDRDNLSAKFWLDPVDLARNRGFRPPELRQVQRLVQEHQAELLEAWHDFFNDND